MQPLQSLDWINSLANASFLWGPFFFSILFILVVTRTAHSYYARVNERLSPPASAEERQDYRNYFRFSSLFGMLLVFVSVGWWIYAQLQAHTFQGVIIGLEQDQQIVATDDDLYYRAVQRDAGNGHLIRDYQFVIVRNTPFVTGQAFRLEFYPNAGAIGEAKPQPVNLLLEYRGGTRGKYMLARDGSTFKLQTIGD
ncbi:cbb3-type cytochrome oxidase subunit 3 [Oxalobacteraceae bacterium GrIS 1.11]